MAVNRPSYKLGSEQFDFYKHHDPSAKYDIISSNLTSALHGQDQQEDFQSQQIQHNQKLIKQTNNLTDQVSAYEDTAQDYIQQKYLIADHRRVSNEKYSNQRFFSEDRDNAIFLSRETNLNIKNQEGLGIVGSSNGSNFNGTKFSNNNNQEQINLKSQNPLLEDDINIGNFAGQGQGRTLSKSQSQSRLLFAPKFKDQQQQLEKIGYSNQGQELLFKHHQHSSANGQNHKTYQLKSSSTQHILSHCSTKECTFCNKTYAMNSHLGSNLCSAIFCAHNQLGMMIQSNLSKKYSTNRDYYNVKTVNDLIYNENTHIVSIFKDYLILDDINEFLKRTYNYSETKVRLPKLCSFYDKYSQVFPNYVVLPESKYMFKNIQKKQKLIDEQYQIQEENANKQHQTLLDEDKLFNSKFYNSVYKMDISMSRQQYEEQAKQISSLNVSKKGISNTRFEDMKIEELMDKFLMKDSQSNIHLITTAGLDFSGFTHSTIAIEKTPHKQQPQSSKNQQINLASSLSSKHSQGDKKESSKNIVSIKQQQQQQQQIMAQKKQDTSKQGSTNPKKAGQQIAMGTLASGNTQLANAVKKQKASFNSTQSKPSNQQLQLQQQQVQVNQKQENSKSSMKDNLINVAASNSSKTTPRLKKSVPYIQDVNSQNTLPLQSQLQQSPATKEAISNYLQHCQIDLTNETEFNINRNIQVLDSTQGVLPTNGEIYESPSIKSPNGSTQKFLMTATSQTVLSQQQKGNTVASSMAFQNNRQVLKSQCLLPNQTQGATAQNQITSLKKSNARMSSGSASAASLHQVHNQLGSKQRGKQGGHGALSPNPQVIFQNPSTLQVANSSHNRQGQPNQSQQQQVQISRNMQHNSTQKSLKSNNSHIKYLSGGTEHYQKILAQQSNNNIVFVTQDSNKGGTANNTNNAEYSSTKKESLNSKQALKQGMHMVKGGNKNNDLNEFGEQEAITGEDCDEGGIADERFASPDGYGTDGMEIGRPSLSTNGQGQNFNVQNPTVLMTISDNDPNANKMLSQYTNYDQIKKHLERYITKDGQQQIVLTAGESLGTQFSEQKNPGINRTQEKIQDPSSSMKMGGGLIGYNRNQMAQSAGTSTSQNNDTVNNSRNGTAQKHFESLKQKIRGVFEQTNMMMQGNQAANYAENIQQQLNPQNLASKTPLKSSIGGNNNKSNAQSLNKNSNTASQIQQNINKRMSLESREGLPIQGQSNQGCLSSTAANGRPLQFPQNQIHGTEQQKYQTNFNLQQRKGSNQIINRQEGSMEQLRVSQNMQSFKESSTSDYSQQNIMKRCATAGKTLSLNDFQNHTFGMNYGNPNLPLQMQQQQQQQVIKQSGSTSNLGNPTIISASKQMLAQQQIFHNNTTGVVGNQNQAANAVRVMTPSYSLASLSKLITPTQQNTSPITMTVNLVNNQGGNNFSQTYGTNQGSGSRKQGASHKKTTTTQNTNHQQQQQKIQMIQSANMMSTSQSQSNLINSKFSNQGGFGMVNAVNNVKNNGAHALTNQQNTKIGGKQMMQKQGRAQTELGGPISNSQQQIREGLNSQLQIQNSQYLMPNQGIQTFQMTPRNQQPQYMSQPHLHDIIHKQVNLNQNENSQSFSCTISTENNNSAAKTLESKHPKFMKTIEEGSVPNSGYNTMLSSTMGKQKSQAVIGFTNPVSQAQYESKSKNKVALANANVIQGNQKRQGGGGGNTVLVSSQSSTHFKSPSQNLNQKKGAAHNGSGGNKNFY